MSQLLPHAKVAEAYAQAITEAAANSKNADPEGTEFLLAVAGIFARAGELLHAKIREELDLPAQPEAHGAR